jgi:protocatechuate 3,4-dioxygenase beta subunit
MPYVICALLLASSLPSAVAAGHLGQVAVSGSVLDVRGAPVEGASVELLPVLSNFGRNERLYEHHGRPKPVAEAQTDRRGRYRLGAPGPGIWRLVIEASGKVPMRYFPLATARSVEVPPVQLLPDNSSVVEVVDGHGRPLPGALVYARPSGPAAWRGVEVDGWRPASRFGWVGASGAIVLPRAAAERLDLTVVPPNRVELISASEIEHGRIVVPAHPLRSVTVRAVDSEGQPVSGLLVGVGDIAWPVGRTGEDGRALLAIGLHRSLSLFLTGPEGSLTKARLSGTTLRAEGAEPADTVTLSVTPAVQVRGRIGRDSDGKGIESALVWPGNDPGRFTTTGPSGDFGLRTAGGGRFWIQTEAPGYLPAIDWIDEPAKTVVRVERRLVPEATLGGRVLGENGNPEDGATVVARTEDTDADAAFRMDRAAARCTTGPDGGFELDGLDPRATYGLRVAQPGYRDWHRDLSAGSLKALEGFQVRLEPFRGGFGRVEGPDGSPIERAVVELRPAPGDGEEARGRSALRSPLDPSNAAAPFSAVTDSHGRFRVDRLPGERVEVSVTREGYAPVLVTSLAIPEGKTPFELRTIRMHRAVRLEGTILDNDNEKQPIQGAEVWLRSDSLPKSALLELTDELAPLTTSDARGHFAVEGLERGRKVFLVVAKEGYRSEIYDVEPRLGQPPLQVVLSRAARVAGTVVSPEGKPVPRAEVTIQLAEPAPGVIEETARDYRGGERDVLTDEEGHFEVAGLFAGEVELVAFKEGWRENRAVTLGLAEGQAVDDLRLVLREGAVLRGRVTTEDERPIAGARVTVGRPVAITDADGYYRVEGVATGTQEVGVWHSRYGRLRRDADLGPGENTLDLTMKKGHTVSGWIVDDADEPVAGAAVSLRPELGRAPRFYRLASDAEGLFELESVADGVYDLEVRKDGYVQTEPAQEVTIDGRDLEDLRVELGPAASITGSILGLDLAEVGRVVVQATSDERPPRIGTVAADGHYEIQALAPDLWTVSARLPREEREVEVATMVEKEEREVHQNLDFDQGLSLSGLVLFDDQALQGALVSVAGLENESVRTVHTNMTGHFRIPGLDAGPYRLTVSHPRIQIVHNERVMLVADQEEEIRLEAASVGGEIVDAGTRKPIEDALVIFAQLLAGPGSEEVSRTTVATNEQGRFFVQHLATGRYRLRVERDGYAPAERPLDLQGARSVSDLRLQLDPADGLVIHARLTSGASPPWIEVRVADRSGRPLLEKTYSMAGGSARVPTVPPGDWQVTVASPGGAAATRTVNVPGPPLDLALPAAGSLEVLVPELAASKSRGVLRAIGPAAGPLVALDGVSGELLTSWELQRGRAQVLGVPPGNWELEVTASDGRTWSGTAIVEADHPTAVRLR